MRRRVEMDRQPTMTERLIEGYHKATKPIAFALMLLVVALSTLPDDLLPERLGAITYSVLLFTLGTMLMQILFDIYEEVVVEEEEPRQLNMLPSNALLSKIASTIEEDDYVKLQYIGVAGRHGWFQVLEKLLNESNPDSLVARKQTFDIGIALLDPKLIHENSDGIYGQFEAVDTVVRQIGEGISYMKTDDSRNLDMHFYQHMPNMLGFLLNDNYLFLTYVYWEDVRGRLQLKAGGADYFVYDRNDDFGGQELIKRFAGWWKYIVNTAEPTGTGTASGATAEGP